MRKKILFSTAAVAVMSVASFAAITSSNQSRELSDLELANIEALTNEEGGSFNCKWSYVGKNELGLQRYVCVKDGSGYDCECGDVAIK